MKHQFHPYIQMYICIYSQLYKLDSVCLNGRAQGKPSRSFRSTQEGSVEIDYERLPKAWSYVTCPLFGFWAVSEKELESTGLAGLPFLHVQPIF